MAGIVALRLWRQAHRSHWFPIQGQSMWPFLQEGDRILVAHGASEIRAGDVILMAYPGPADGGTRLVAHRLLRRQRRGDTIIFQTKGDSRRRPDPPLPASALAGKVIAVARGGRVRRVDGPLWRALGWFLAWAGPWMYRARSCGCPRRRRTR